MLLSGGISHSAVATSNIIRRRHALAESEPFCSTNSFQSGNTFEKNPRDHRITFARMLYRTGFPLLAEEFPGRVRQNRAFRSSSAVLPRVRPVNARWVALRASFRTQGRSMRTVGTFSLWLFIAAAVLFCIPALVTGQDSATGSIRGTVFDPTGARIPQALVVVVNSGTAARHTATTDAEGHFALELPPGDYSARVEAQGMSPQVTPQLHVDIGGTATLDFRLKIAGTQESLTVSETPSMIETKPAAVSTLLDERSVNDFPLNGRRFL